MTVASSSHVLGTFRGDFEALATMIQRSWANNPNQSLLYNEAFLRSVFDYPGSSFELAPSAYGDAGLLGFVAGFPRCVRWDGHPARLILNSFLSVSNAIKGAGLGLKLWAALIERCRDEGYEGTINFCVEGDDMNRIMPGLSHFLKLNTQRIFSVEFLVRILNAALPESSPQNLRFGDRPLHGTCFVAAEQLAACAPMDTSRSRMAVSQAGRRDFGQLLCGRPAWHAHGVHHAGRFHTARCHRTPRRPIMGQSGTGGANGTPRKVRADCRRPRSTYCLLSCARLRTARHLDGCQISPLEQGASCIPDILEWIATTTGSSTLHRRPLTSFGARTGSFSLEEGKEQCGRSGQLPCHVRGALVYWTYPLTLKSPVL